MPLSHIYLLHPVFIEGEGEWGWLLVPEITDKLNIFETQGRVGSKSWRGIQGQTMGFMSCCKICFKKIEIVAERNMII